MPTEVFPPLRSQSDPTDRVVCGGVSHIHILGPEAASDQLSGFLWQQPKNTPCFSGPGAVRSAEQYILSHALTPVRLCKDLLRLQMPAHGTHLCHLPGRPAAAQKLSTSLLTTNRV